MKTVENARGHSKRGNVLTLTTTLGKHANRPHTFIPHLPTLARNISLYARSTLRKVVYNS